MPGGMNVGFWSVSNQPLPKPELDSQPLSPPRTSIARTAISAYFPQLRSFETSAIFSRSKEEFDIAFGPCDGARLDPQHGPALLFNPALGLVANPFVDRRVPDHPALPDLCASGFELRLDQRDQSGAGLCQAQRRLQHLGKPNETRVANNDVDRLRDDGRIQTSRIGLLMHDHARVL